MQGKLCSPPFTTGETGALCSDVVYPVIRLLLVRPEVHSHVHLTPGVLWILSSRLINTLPQKTSTIL